MTEILTESFCERCGTRYTFESAAPRRSRIGRVRTLSKGMKNFVLSDDASFSEAMAEARSEEEFAAVSHQLDAFHQTFNFCLTCRQYTCGDCWNTAEGRCLTCAPIPGMDEPALPAALFVDTLPEPTEAYADGPEADESWPDADLSAARLSRALGLDEAEAEATLEAGTTDDTFDLAAAEAAAAAVATPVDAPAGTPWVDDSLPEPANGVVDAADAVGVEDADAVSAVHGVAPGQSLEDAVAEYEARIAAEEAEEAEEAEGIEVSAAAAAVAAAAAIDQPVAEIEVEDVAPIELPEPVAEVPEVAVAPEAVAADDAADELPEAGATVVAPTVPDPEPVVAIVEPPEAEPAAAIGDVPAIDEDAPLAAAAATASAVETEDDVAVEAEAEPAPEPERAAPAIAAAAAIAAVTDTPDVPDVPRVDVVPQPTWPEPAPVRAPDVAARPAETPAPQANPWLTVAPDESDEPQWPAAPAFPVSTPRRDMPTTLAGRPLIPRVDPADMWAASAREVLTGTPQAPIPVAAPAPTAQPCVSCGLSLSANARFCRRCGTRQA